MAVECADGAGKHAVLPNLIKCLPPIETQFPPPTSGIPSRKRYLPAKSTRHNRTNVLSATTETKQTKHRRKKENIPIELKNPRPKTMSYVQK